MAFASWERLLLASWDFCSAVWEALIIFLPLESIKKLDSTPNDQSNFASSHNGSMPSGMKIPYNFPAAERVRILKKASELKHFPH